MRKADPGKLSAHFSWLMALVLALGRRLVAARADPA